MKRAENLSPLAFIGISLAMLGGVGIWSLSNSLGVLFENLLTLIMTVTVLTIAFGCVAFFFGYVDWRWGLSYGTALIYAIVRMLHAEYVANRCGSFLSCEMPFYLGRPAMAVWLILPILLGFFAMRRYLNR